MVSLEKVLVGSLICLECRSGRPYSEKLSPNQLMHSLILDSIHEY